MNRLNGTGKCEMRSSRFEVGKALGTEGSEEGERTEEPGPFGAAISFLLFDRFFMRFCDLSTRILLKSWVHFKQGGRSNTDLPPLLLRKIRVLNFLVKRGKKRRNEAKSCRKATVFCLKIRKEALSTTENAEHTERTARRSAEG